MTSDSLSAIFAALADPTRRAILARLRSRAMSVGDLSKPFTLSPPAITKHLKVLERSGLISRTRDAQWRVCRLEAKPLKKVVDWVEEYRQFWDESFDRLDEHLKSLNKRDTRSRRT